MDIFLANAGVKTKSKHSRQNPPLGLAYIASVLLEDGYEVVVQDFNVMNFTPVLMANLLRQWQPRVLGISVNTETYTNGLALAKVAKSVDPNISVVMGGPHATPMYREILGEKDIDIVVLGEGEYTMLELADGLVRNAGDVAQIKGIAYRKEGIVYTTPERPFIKNPDELPFPARELFPLPFYENPVTVLVSRGGCPFACRFCAVNNIWKGRRCYRNPQKVLDEITSVITDGMTQKLSFADDAFSLNRECALELCGLLKRQVANFNLNWICSTRVDLVDDELLREMRSAGCRNIQYGIEAGSQKILNSIGKKTNLDQIRKAISATMANDIGATCSFMYPHPEDTGETIWEQAQFMKELVDMGVEVTLAMTTPFPGTYYYEHMAELGIKLLTHDWDEFDGKHLIIETGNLKREKLDYLLQELIQYVGLKANIEGSRQLQASETL